MEDFDEEKESREADIWQTGYEEGLISAYKEIIRWFDKHEFYKDCCPVCYKTAKKRYDYLTRNIKL